MKNVKMQFNYNELNLLHGGLGHYYDYLEKMKKKESAPRRRELEAIQRDIEKLVSVIVMARSNAG